jgi:hypothetical protein
MTEILLAALGGWLKWPLIGLVLFSGGWIWAKRSAAQRATQTSVKARLKTQIEARRNERDAETQDDLSLAARITRDP